MRKIDRATPFLDGAYIMEITTTKHRLCTKIGRFIKLIFLWTKNATGKPPHNKIMDLPQMHMKIDCEKNQHCKNARWAQHASQCAPHRDTAPWVLMNTLGRLFALWASTQRAIQEGTWRSSDWGDKDGRWVIRG